MILCQLYSDVMSTYGDQGNMLYLEYFLALHDVPCKTIYHTLEKPIPRADIYLFGGGQDSAQSLVALDFQEKNGELLLKYLACAYCLAVCGGYQLLGKYYLNNVGKLVMGLGYLPVMTVASKERAVGPIVITRQFGQHQRTLVGFENHSGQTYLLDALEPLGRVVRGSGNNQSDKSEGIVFGKTIGTYLHGPILPRNPHLAYWWLKDLITQSSSDRAPKLVIERAAHRSYLKEIDRRFIKSYR